MKNDPHSPEILPVRCIIHREHLSTIHFKYEDFMKYVVKTRQFYTLKWEDSTTVHKFNKELELEDKPSNVSFYGIVAVKQQCLE